MQEIRASIPDGPNIFRTPSSQGVNQDYMIRPRHTVQQTPPTRQSTTSLNDGRGPAVTTAVVSAPGSRTPQRRQLPQPPMQPAGGQHRTGSQLSLTGKGQGMPDNRGEGVLENGYQPNMNQHIAMAIRSGQSPYAIYGLEDTGEDDDWC